MKKLMVFVTLFALLLAATVLPASAAVVDASTLEKPEDITADVKWVTLYDLYAQKLPVVRADAQLILANDYDMALVGKAASGQARTIQITDWAEKGFTSFFDNYFDLADGDFCFDSATWANKVDGDTWDDRARLTYTFSVDEAGTYELVFIGCAEIKAENVDNDAKDRGFAFSVDDGKIRQVNISDTRGIFRGYNYTYSGADLESKMETTTNGVNSGFYEPTYYYGITVDLTAGSHTLEFYHLFYSGDTQMTGNGARLNFMGFYVEKYLSDIEFDSYVYPETTLPDTTPAPQPDTTTTEKKDTTPAPTQDETTTPAPTPADTTTPAPKDTTTAAPTTEKSGCGSVMSLAALAAIIPAAVVLKRRKK